MSTIQNILNAETFKTNKRHHERKKHIKEKSSEISESYKYDIKKYISYCFDTHQSESDLNSILDYLYVSLTIEEVKKNTWERRLAAIKKYLSVEYDFNFIKHTDWVEEITVMRKLYNEEKYKDLIQSKGKSDVDKNELLKMIRELSIRGKAICLVQLITANRPNEMVRLKVKDFDLDNRSVSVYLKKQKEWHSKRLTQETVKAVKDYISEYNLKPDDYFVGRLNKNKEYMSMQASDSGYRYMLNKWTGLTGYNFRKTQVVAMHVAGADLPTIAKQTGHRSLGTIEKHYLDVSDPTVDKYL